jgi:hypothetical protein
MRSLPGRSFAVFSLVLAVVLSCVITPAVATAQETTGTITGVVTDDSGAVLPGVTVSLKHVETGRTTEVVSTDGGFYSATALPTGAYELTFTLSGFQPRTVTGIRVSVNDRLQINGTLAVGGLAEKVEVSASTQLVQPISAVQSLIGSRQVQELPLNNRNFVQLATLVPGVSSDLGDEVGVGLTSTVSISINGSRRNGVNWLLDGAQNVDVGSNITLLSTPTLESIEEFKIITSSYAAEWPRSGGGVVNVVTKSGSNTFRGSGYEFFRNDSLNANNFFRNLSSDPNVSGKPAGLRYNNFGYTVGGPVEHDKLFFFFSEEWRRITRASSTTATVPDPSWLTDPTNANYVAPADRDPLAVKLLAAWPTPNIPGKNQYLSSQPAVNNTRQEVLRMDYDVAHDWRLTGRYTHDLSQTIEPGGLFQGYLVPNVGTTNTNVPGNVGVITLRTSKSSWLNEVSYQFSGNTISDTTPGGTRGFRSDYALTNTELFPGNAGDYIPSVAISGLSSIGSSQLYNIEYRDHTFTDNLTLQHGSHSLKMGGLITLEQKNENAAGVTQGTYTFVGVTGGRTAFQNFLTGNRDAACPACAYSEDQIDITEHLRFNRYELYAQDTWHVTPHITLDYGLRYSLYPPITDRNDVLDTFDPSFFNPAQAPTFANAAGTTLVSGTGNPTNGIVIANQTSPFGRGVYAYDKNNVQPRAGVSWDPIGNGNMIVRAGYGVYYDQPLVGIFEQNSFVNPPFNNRVQVLNPSLANPASGIAPSTRAPLALQATSADFDTPRTQQWNIGVQRQIYSHGAIDVGYVGSRGDELIRPLDINQPQPADVVALGAINLARPYAGYAGITMRNTTARNRYNGLLVSFKHEQASRGSFTLNYTLSRNRTDASNDRDTIDFPQNPLDPFAEYADARTDRRHVFSANFIYPLPFFEQSNALLKNTLGGWELSGIVNMASGAPIPRILVDTNAGRRGNRANLVGDPKDGDLDIGGSNFAWFDKTAFALPVDGTYGNTPRGFMRLPGRQQWDLSLSKNFRPVERLRLQFRADMINAFNHTQFSAVDASYVDTVFGQVTAARAPREIQLGLKVYW